MTFLLALLALCWYIGLPALAVGSDILDGEEEGWWMFAWFMSILVPLAWVISLGLTS